jgi:ABC-type sugar transport system ATPase subunit
VARVLFDEVTKVYPGPVVAVQDLTLEVADGEFLILVGPSGCGKSTALRMVAGLERISAGTIAIGDRVVNDVPPKERDIAMVFQNYALYPHMTVERNLAFGLRRRRTPRDDVRRRVGDIARMLGIEGLLGRRPGQLSGGQRQRVAMGRALVREPDVFLLDEPLSNLDAKLRVEMRAELKRLQGRLGVTTIYVTHDQVEAMTLGERIAVLSEGLLQQVGSPQDVYDEPANVFVAGFIGSPPMNLLKGKASGGRILAGDLEVEAARVPDGEVLVGIRPEALHPVGEDHPGPGMEVRVEVLEPLGDEVLVHGTVEASTPAARTGTEEAALLADAPLLAAAPGRGNVRLRLPPRDRPAPGTRLRVAVALEDVHVFDEATGLAVPLR